MNEQITKNDQEAKDLTNREGKYLTFSLVQEEYGLGILKVKEIIGLMPITTVSRLDTEYILGMAKMNDGVKILLEFDKLVTGEAA